MTKLIIDKAMVALEAATRIRNKHWMHWDEASVNDMLVAWWSCTDPDIVRWISNGPGGQWPVPGADSPSPAPAVPDAAKPEPLS